MIDTSGSMSDNQIAQCYSEIYGAIGQFNDEINPCAAPANAMAETAVPAAATAVPLPHKSSIPPTAMVNNIAIRAIAG